MNSQVLDWVPDLWAFLRRSWRIVLTGTAVVLGLAVIYLIVARPGFTASSVVMVDVQAAAPFQEQAGAVDSAYSNGLAESEVEILQSMGLAREVVRMLQLQDNKAFLANGGSRVGWALGLLSRPFTASAPATATSRETAAAEILGHMIRVRRVGLSFILELDVTSDSADLSAQLNNALVDAFVLSGIEAKTANTKRASVWLQQRIAELQGQATAADRAVQDFKAEARIVDTDKGLMEAQHIGELTTQLVLARARVADATARRARIREIIASDDGGEGVSAELDNAVIIHLREQYVDAADQAAQLTARVGPNHDSVVQLRLRMQDLKLQIRSELDRIAQGTESDYKVALANQSDLQHQLDGLVTAAEQTNYSLVRLRELQSAADTYKALYADFLQRYTEAVQNQSFPISNIRVVTRAETPLRQSSPHAALVLGVALVAGIAFSLTAALVWESFDRGIRTAAQVLSGLGLPCLGMLPALKLTASDARARRWEGAVANASVDPRLIAAPAILRQVMLRPFSSYGEAIRGLRFKLARRSDSPRDGGVIGFASAQPGEGKTTVAANFAFFLAGAGFRTLLVDWDLRRQALSQTLSPGRQSGFADVVAGAVALDAAMWRDTTTGLSFLPAAGFGTTPGAGGLREPDMILATFGELLTSLRDRFDYIIVDLPPLSPVVDTAVAARLLDGIVIVVEWGRTPLAVVQDSIAQSQIDRERLRGVVLNKVDFDKVGQYYAPAQADGSAPLVPA
jgi:succinoglycan biosynthesis transport protein ExoP